MAQSIIMKRCEEQVERVLKYQHVPCLTNTHRSLTFCNAFLYINFNIKEKNVIVLFIN